MSAPTPAPDDILEGICENNNFYFWSYFVSATFLSLLIMFCRHKTLSPPTFKGPKCTPDYGRPYAIGVLLYHICLWNMAPQACYFFVFHVLSTNLFPMQTNSACIQMASIPFIVIFVFAQATMILVVYNPNSMVIDIGSVVTPEHAQADEESKTPPKVLILGCTGRGALLIDALQKEARGATRSETTMVDYGHALAGAFVRYNAHCTNVYEKVASRFCQSTWRGNNKFLLPFPDHSFDRVVVSPYVRSAPPVGEFMTSDDVKAPRMVRMLREAMRVLKPGGELFAYDNAANIVPLWADCRDAGFKANIMDSGVTAGPLFFMKAKMLKLHCPHQELAPDAASPVGSVATPLMETANGDLDDDVRVDIVGDDVHVQRSDGASTAAASSGDALFAAMLALQIAIFVVLMFVAAALYEPLSVPTSIPLSTRVNNLVVTIPTSYPMMAYFSRDAVLNGETVPHTIPQLLHRCLVSEGLAILASLLFTALLGIPGFLMQLALTDTSLSSDNKSLIGIGISVFLAVMLYKRGRASARTRSCEKRQIPEDYVQNYLQ